MRFQKSIIFLIKYKLKTKLHLKIKGQKCIEQALVLNCFTFVRHCFNYGKIKTVIRDDNCKSTPK